MLFEILQRSSRVFLRDSWISNEVRPWSLLPTITSRPTLNSPLCSLGQNSSRQLCFEWDAWQLFARRYAHVLQWILTYESCLVRALSYGVSFFSEDWRNDHCLAQPCSGSHFLDTSFFLRLLLFLPPCTHIDTLTNNKQTTMHTHWNPHAFITWPSNRTNTNKILMLSFGWDVTSVTLFWPGTSAAF